MKKFFALESIRGIAALIIAFAHFDKMILNSRHFSRPALAVDLFFILSGFILGYNYFNKFRNNAVSLKKYTLKRLARLYPLHIFTLFILLFFYLGTTILENLQTGNPLLEYFPVIKDGRNYSDGYIKTFVINLLFVNGSGLNRFDATWNYPSWSTSSEFFVCLLLYPFCKIISTKIRKLIYISSIGLSYFLLAIFIGHLSSHSSNLFGFISVGLLRVIGGFFIGVWMLEVFSRIGNSIKILPFTLIEIFLYSLIAFLIVRGDYPYVDFSAIPIISGVIFISAFERGYITKFLSKKSWVFLGGLSYSIYLNHVFVIGLFQYFQLFSIIGSISKSNFVIITLNTILYFIILIGLSTLTFFYLEKPLRTYLYKKI